MSRIFKLISLVSILFFAVSCNNSVHPRTDEGETNFVIDDETNKEDEQDENGSEDKDNNENNNNDVKEDESITFVFDLRMCNRVEKVDFLYIGVTYSLRLKSNKEISCSDIVVSFKEKEVELTNSIPDDDYIYNKFDYYVCIHNENIDCLHISAIVNNFTSEKSYPVMENSIKSSFISYQKHNGGLIENNIFLFKTYNKYNTWRKNNGINPIGVDDTFFENEYLLLSFVYVSEDMIRMELASAYFLNGTLYSQFKIVYPKRQISNLIKLYMSAISLSKNIPEINKLENMPCRSYSE